MNRLLKTHSKTGDLGWRRQNGGKIIFLFLLISNRKKRSRPTNSIYFIWLHTIYTSTSKIWNFQKIRNKTKFWHIVRDILFNEMNEIKWIRWSGRIKNLASLSEIFFLFSINEGLNLFLPNRIFVAKIMIQSMTKSKKKRGNIWKKNKRWHSEYFWPVISEK